MDLLLRSRGRSAGRCIGAGQENRGGLKPKIKMKINSTLKIAAGLALGSMLLYASYITPCYYKKDIACAGPDFYFHLYQCLNQPGHDTGAMVHDAETYPGNRQVYDFETGYLNLKTNTAQCSCQLWAYDITYGMWKCSVCGEQHIYPVRYWTTNSVVPVPLPNPDNPTNRCDKNGPITNPE